MTRGTKSTPNFEQATARFRDAGIPARALLPLIPADAKISSVGDLDENSLGKIPGRYNERARDWRGLGGSYITTGLHDGDFEKFASWPTPNVGILGRFAPAIDVDAENEDGRRFVERVMVRAFGDKANYATRLRGDGPRRLYAFKSASVNDPDLWVRTRRLAFRLKGEGETNKPHKIDVQGYGTHYVITGTHPSGDLYEWDQEWDFADLFASKEIEVIDNNDVSRFVDTLREMLDEEGGELLRSTGGRAPGEERDYSDQDPIFEVREIFKGLERIPNNAANFETRDEFVSMLASIRAALGREAEAERDQIEAWACADPAFCWPEYFDKAWESLERGVRVDRDSLDRRFKRAGVFASAAADFDVAGTAERAGIREDKAERKEAKDDVLAEVASKYIFGRVNTATDDATPRMRSFTDPAVEWQTKDWWAFKSDDHNTDLVAELHESFPANEAGMWNFIRALRRYELADKRRRIFYTGTTRDPNYDRGEIVVEENPDETQTRLLNMRFVSPVIRHAKFPPKDPRQAREDVETLLEFIKRVFGAELWQYELDTLAYMAQTGRRPGHMLLLIGDSGVGKSTYIQMLISMFDGIGRNMGGQIDGTKLTNEAARRFALANTEGCRIISVKELPEGSSAQNMAAVTAAIKQLVDPGPDGDYYQVEAKGKDTRSVRNYARVVASSNYENALQIEAQDRRIFYVRCGIEAAERPEEAYYIALHDVTGNPERLAAFWRFLKARDVSHYDPAKAPPMSKEKREAQIAGLPRFERHLVGALEVYRKADRALFDLAELGELMTAMSENEYRNTNESVDDRKTYDFSSGAGQSAANLKKLNTYAIKVCSPRTSAERLPPIYGLRSLKPRVEPLRTADKGTVLEALERDRQKRLSGDHPFRVFEGPLKPSRQR